MAGVIVEVGGRRFLVPYECPCCGAAPDTELIVALTPTKERPVAAESACELGFAYCRKCVAHSLAWESSSNLETGVKVLGLLTAILVGLATHAVVGLLVFAAAVALAWWIGRTRRARAHAQAGPACAWPGVAVAYLGWSGNASSLYFESHVYAARLAEQNATKLVNVTPQLRQVMEGHKLARLAVPTPAAAVRTVPAAATVGDWTARIVAAPNRAARLDVLQKGLDAFADRGDRDALITAASQLELAAILERIERQAPAAWTRELQKSIIAARADNIPDELRDALVPELEGRLR